MTNNFLKVLSRASAKRFFNHFSMKNLEFNVLLCKVRISRNKLGENEPELRKLPVNCFKQTSILSSQSSQLNSKLNLQVHFEVPSLIGNYVIKLPSLLPNLEIPNKLWNPFVKSFVKHPVTFKY